MEPLKDAGSREHSDGPPSDCRAQWWYLQKHSSGDFGYDDPTTATTGLVDAGNVEGMADISNTEPGQPSLTVHVEHEKDSKAPNDANTGEEEVQEVTENKFAEVAGPPLRKHVHFKQPAAEIIDLHSSEQEHTQRRGRHGTDTSSSGRGSD